MKQIRYTIVIDDSGHDYYIPVNQTDNWEQWIGSEEWELGEVPDYAGYIDGNFTFTDPETT